MKLRIQIHVLSALIAIILVTPAVSRADAITFWNQVTISAAAGQLTSPPQPGRPGPSSVLDIATVHLAMYDAVQAIEGDYRPYCGAIVGATGSTEAAAATAAHDVLVSRFPAQANALDTILQSYLASQAISMLDAGIPVGTAAAACVVQARSGDGSFPVGYPPFFGDANKIGVWRPTSGGSMAAPWLAQVTPFTIKDPSQFRPGPPPALTSPEYIRAYNEVKALGRNSGSTRTLEQTETAYFWNMNYPAQLNLMIRELSAARVSNISDNSRLFALTSTAMADSIITAWDSKVTYAFWRPITAIKLGDQDDNPKTEGDPTWDSLIPAPPYPDYTSGANNVTASATRALQMFFGTNNMTVTVTTNAAVPSGNQRTFKKFSDIRDEVVEARIYEGIHFRFADELARKQGEHVAQWAYGHFFRPVE